MCIVLLAYRQHPRYPLIILSNRDEFYSRESAPLQLWQQSPAMYAGIDLASGGTWLGVNTKGNFAAVTNYRGVVKEIARFYSRGEIVKNILTKNLDEPGKVKKMMQPQHYAGCNLLWGDVQKIHYFCNKFNQYQELQTGIQGMSNGLWGAPWPKITLGKKLLSAVLQEKAIFSVNALMAILENTEFAEAHALPHTYLTAGQEKMVSSIFVRSAEYQYGTRASSIVLFGQDGDIDFYEKRYNFADDAGTVSHYRFTII